MDINEQASDKIVYFALTLNNFIMLLLVLLLRFELGLSLTSTGGTIFIIGFIISAITMIFISIKALNEDADRSKTIIRLAIFHVPCLMGLVVFLITGFELI